MRIQYVEIGGKGGVETKRSRYIAGNKSQILSSVGIPWVWGQYSTLDSSQIITKFVFKILDLSLVLFVHHLAP